MPAAEKRFPNAVHQQHICPEEQLRVVPGPGRKTDEPARDKGYHGRKKEAAKRGFLMVDIVTLRNTKVNQESERERQNETEIIEPEPPGGFARWIHPTRLPSEGVGLAESGNT